VLDILRRDLIPLGQVEIWSKSFTEPDGKEWKGAFVEEERNRAYQNTRNLLRSIYLALLVQQDDFPNRDPAAAFIFESLNAIRPY
jgi:hypothetical protein